MHQLAAGGENNCQGFNKGPTSRYVRATRSASKVCATGGDPASIDYIEIRPNQD
jgi:hypothetical protein